MKDPWEIARVLLGQDQLSQQFKMDQTEVFSPFFLCVTQLRSLLHALSPQPT